MTNNELGRLSAYATVADMDKPFHLPECSCGSCEAWRESQGRPTMNLVEQRIRELRLIQNLA
jgi:hypothetical protein